MVNVRATMHSAGQNITNTVSHLYHRMGDGASYVFDKMPMSGWIKGLFQAHQPLTPSLNTKFLEPISLSTSPVSKMQIVAYMVALAAGTMLAAYAGVGLVGALAVSRVSEVAVSLLGFSVGSMVMLSSLEKIFNALASLKDIKMSKEQQLFKELNESSDADVQAKFKAWTSLDLGAQYTVGQADQMKKEAKVMSLEKAVLPALIRFKLKADQAEAIEKAYPARIVQGLDEEMYLENPIQQVLPLSHEDNVAFLERDRMISQKFYTAKLEAAFELAVLLYPDKMKQVSLSDLGTIEDYSASSSYIPAISNLPFFLGKPLNAQQGVPSVFSHEMKYLSLHQLAHRLSNTYNLPQQ